MSMFMFMFIFLLIFIITIYILIRNNIDEKDLQKYNNEYIKIKLIKLKRKQFIIRCILLLPFLLTLIFCIYGMIDGVNFCMAGICTKEYGINALKTIFTLLIFIGWIYIIFIVLIIVFEIIYKKKLEKITNVN